MGDDTPTEKGVLVPAAGAVKKLVGEKNVFGSILFLEAADCRDGDNPAHIKVAHGPKVGAVIEFGGEDAVTASMTGEEDEAPTIELTNDQSVRRRAKRCVDNNFLPVREALNVIKTTTANDADSWRLVDGERV